jgi:hypothetical protein
MREKENGMIRPLFYGYGTHQMCCFFLIRLFGQPGKHCDGSQGSSLYFLQALDCFFIMCSSILQGKLWKDDIYYLSSYVVVAVMKLFHCCFVHARHTPSALLPSSLLAGANANDRSSLPSNAIFTLPFLLVNGHKFHESLFIFDNIDS